jgi:hypothetical protein
MYFLLIVYRRSADEALRVGMVDKAIEELQVAISERDAGEIFGISKTTFKPILFWRAVEKPIDILKLPRLKPEFDYVCPVCGYTDFQMDGSPYCAHCGIRLHDPRLKEICSFPVYE